MFKPENFKYAIVALFKSCYVKYLFGYLNYHIVPGNSIQIDCYETSAEIKNAQERRNKIFQTGTQNPDPEVSKHGKNQKTTDQNSALPEPIAGDRDRC